MRGGAPRTSQAPAGKASTAVNTASARRTSPHGATWRPARPAPRPAVTKLQRVWLIAMGRIIPWASARASRVRRALCAAQTKKMPEAGDRARQGHGAPNASTLWQYREQHTPACGLTVARLPTLASRSNCGSSLVWGTGECVQPSVTAKRARTHVQLRRQQRLLRKVRDSLLGSRAAGLMLGLCFGRVGAE